MIKHVTQWILLTALPGILAVQADLVIQNESLDTGFELRFPSETDFRYTIQYRDDLTNGEPWQELEGFRDVEGTGETLSYLDTEVLEPNVARRYYRIRIEPDASETDRILALYEFTDKYPAAQVVYEEVNATDFSISSSTLSYGTFQSTTWTGSGVPYAYGTSGWGALNPLDAKYFAYTITANEGTVFSITNIHFLCRASAAGPSAIGVFINDKQVYTEDMPQDETISTSISVADFKNMTQAVIRIVGWHNDSRDTEGTGEFRVDDVRTTGTASAAREPEPPTVTNPSFLNISDTTATLGGTISDDGGVVITERGIYWSSTEGFTPPSEGTKVSEAGEFGEGAFTRGVSDLPSDSTIYFRAFATNSAGISLSEEASFKTTAEPALALTVVMDPVALEITENTAELGGTITDDGGGLLVERGVYWSTFEDFDPPEEGNKVYETGEYELESFSISVVGLPRDTIIYYRVFAANAEQVGYSELSSFMTLADNELAFYSFSGNTAEPESHRDSIAAASLVISEGLFRFSWGDDAEWESLGGGNPYIEASGGGYWSATTQSDARYYEVALNTDSGWLMTITGVTYLAQATRQGPSAVGVAINGDNIHAEDMPDGTVIRVSATVSGYDNTPQAVIRLQGWDNNTRNTTGRGAFRVDNVQVYGYMSMDANVGVPIVTTPTVSGIQSHSATLGGNLEETGGATVNERGIYWSTVENFSPPAEGTKVSEPGSFGVGAFTLTVSPLPADTLIYFRAFATSAAGTGFSDQSSFTTDTYDPSLLALYEFTDRMVTPHARHPHITSSHFVHNTGRPGFGTANESSWTGSGVPYAQLAGNLARTSVTNARHFVYAIESRTGTTFDITNISFMARATAQGPSALSVAIETNVIFTQNMPANQTLTFNIPVSGHDEQSLVAIRILGWDNGSRDTEGTGLLQIDDVRTQGAVNGSVSEPVTDGRLVRVASYNTELGIGAVDSDNYNALKAVLHRMDADIVAFQELYASESNQWAALAADLGYTNVALASEGGQRTGYFSRFPIQSTHEVQSPPPANEMTRPVFRAVFHVPDADQPLVIWNAHKKAMGDEVSQFRRAVETIRILQDIDAYSAAHAGHTEFIVLGDMNADLFTQPQAISFSEEWFADNESELPSAYELGDDIAFPVLYARFPEDRYVEANHGFHRPVITQADGNGLYTFEDNNFISRLDYLYVSEPLAAKVPAGEIYHSKHDGAFAGLPKAGDPLPTDTSWTASDHLPVFVDIYMTSSNDAMDPMGTETTLLDESTEEQQDIVSDDERIIDKQRAEAKESGDTDTESSNELRVLSDVGSATRLHIVSRPDGRVEVLVPTEPGFLYTVESTSRLGNTAKWTIEGETQRATETDEPISSFVVQPVSNDGIRIYRVRVKKAP